MCNVDVIYSGKYFLRTTFMWVMSLELLHGLTIWAESRSGPSSIEQVVVYRLRVS
jgi:hypothetical protein